MAAFNKSHLKAIAGGRSGKIAPRKNMVCFCTYVDGNGRRALFCEVSKFTVVYAFFSLRYRKYVTVTLGTGRKRFSNYSAERIISEWEKMIQEADIGPNDCGRCFLSESYEEAVAEAHKLIYELMHGPHREMSDNDTKLCVSVFTELFVAGVSKVIGLET